MLFIKYHKYINSSGIDYMEIRTIDQYVQQQNAKEQFKSKEKWYERITWISIIISMTIMVIVALRLFEINLIGLAKYLVGLSFSSIVFTINYLVYESPFLYSALSKKSRYSPTDYSYIIKEQNKPTTIKYKIRKVLLITLNIIGLLLILGNVVILFIEMIL